MKVCKAYQASRMDEFIGSLRHMTIVLMLDANSEYRQMGIS